MPGRSLIVKLGSIGDVAATIPAAWKLHRTAETEIDWLCGKVVAPLLACYGWIHPIVVDDRRLLGKNRVAAVAEVLRVWKSLMGASYETCAVLQYDARYRLLCLPARARRSVALDWDERAFQLVSERHHTAEYARILCGLADEYREENLAPLAPECLPENPLPRGSRRRIALAPGGARNLLRDDPQRRWPLEAYAALARQLLDENHEVVITGGPDDDWIRPQFADLAVECHIGVWSIPQTVAFYASCDCVVTHDSGPLHLAGLTRCGLVGLFGPTAPSKALPRRAGAIALWGGERLPCRPCYDGRECAACTRNGCLISIGPERVAATVRSLLAAPGAEWSIESL